jgi:hypothetical protein
MANTENFRTSDQFNAALKKYIDPSKPFIVTAVDFKTNGPPVVEPRAL